MDGVICETFKGIGKHGGIQTMTQKGCSLVGFLVCFNAVVSTCKEYGRML